MVAEGVDDLLVREGLADQFVDLSGVFKVTWNYFYKKKYYKFLKNGNLSSNYLGFYVICWH